MRSIRNAKINENNLLIKHRMGKEKKNFNRAELIKIK